jgi:hypothetical protein
MARTSVQFGPAHACLEGRQQGWERLLPPAALRPEAQPHTWGQLGLQTRTQCCAARLMWNQQSAPMQPSSSTAAGPAAASTAMPAAAAYAQAFAQAAENVPRPPVPAVLTVADRGVSSKAFIRLPVTCTHAPSPSLNAPYHDVLAVG